MSKEFTVNIMRETRTVATICMVRSNMVSKYIINTL